MNDSYLESIALTEHFIEASNNVVTLLSEFHETARNINKKINYNNLREYIAIVIDMANKVADASDELSSVARSLGENWDNRTK